MKKLIFSVLIISVALLFMSCGKKNESANTDAKQQNEIKTDTKKDISANAYHIKYESKSDRETVMMEYWVKGNNFKMDVNTKRGNNTDVSVMYVFNKVAYMRTDIAGEKMDMKADVNEELESTMNFEITNVNKNLKDYQKLGTEEVLGNKCDIYQTKNGDKFSVYKNMYVLKILDRNFRSYTPLIFEPDAELADDFFSPPKDVEFMNMEDMMK